jgi:HlyD family secretion protein
MAKTLTQHLSTGRRGALMGKRFVAIVVVVAVGIALYLVLRPRPRTGDWVEGSGVIEATEVDVSPLVGGKLVSVEVAEGEEVAADQVVAQIETTDLRAQLRQAQGSLQAARGDLARSEAALQGAASTLANAQTAYAKSTELKGRYEQAQEQYPAALAAREQAKARLDLLRAGTRKEEIEQARAAVVSAEADWRNAERELKRLQGLLAEGAVSQQQVDLQQSREKALRGAYEAASAGLAVAEAGARSEEVRQAQAAVAQAEANVVVAQRALETARELYGDKLDLKQRLDTAQAEHLAALEARASAQGRVETAQGALAAAEKRLRDAVVKAPLSGTALLKIREPGETVSPGQPIVRLANLGDMWLRVYVPETDMHRVKLGQAAEVMIDGAPGKAYKGRVTEIAQEAEFTPKNVQTREQRVKLVFGVKVSVENPERELKPGMPADARIHVGPTHD